MAKQPQDQLLSDEVATSEDKAAILIQMIKRPSAFDDFLSMGTNLTDDDFFGPRFCKMARNVQIEGEEGVYAGTYCGEWSLATQKPHGRGVLFRSDGTVYIRYFENGSTKCRGGKALVISGSSFGVGPRNVIGGVRHDHVNYYFLDGRTSSVHWVDGKRQN